MEIRALRQSDDRGLFHSGDCELDRFFQKFAGQNQFRYYLGVTYVAVEGEQILGFATVAPGQLEIDELPATTRDKLPRYPLPILRLARLAVDGQAQGRGIGRKLLRFILQMSLRMAKEFGCTGVVVDAKRNAVKFYSQHGFQSLDLAEGLSEARPQPQAMFLSIRAIKAALAPGNLRTP